MSNTPKIRFAGFTDAWEQRKVGELTIESSEYAILDTGLPLLTSSRSGLMYQNEYRGKQTTDSKETLFSIVPLGACTYRHMSDDDIFHLNVNRLEKGLVSREYPVFYASENNNLDFIVQQINSSAEFRSFCAEQKKGGTRTRLYYKNLCEFQMLVPNAEEQEEIATFLITLDYTITLHQRKCDALQKFKKSMLQKMFPRDGENVPEIRFAGFTDAWEQRKLGELATFINGRAYSQDELLSSGKYKVLRVGNFYTNDSWYYSDMELEDKYYAENGDLLYTWSATFGPHIWCGDKVIYHYHIWKIELTQQLEKRFAVQLLEQDKAAILSDKNGSTMVHITKAGMEEKAVLLPQNIDEQVKIGAFLNNIDSLITLHQRKLGTLQKMKKSLLQKMFV